MPLDALTLAKAFLTIGEKNGWCRNELPPIDGFPRPWFYRPSGLRVPCRLYLSTGIHGDEPAGPSAVLHFLRHPEWFRGCEVFLFPLLNPVGLSRGTRENPQGIDLNRDYRNPQSAEVPGHLAALDTLPASDLYIHLHEDWEAAGAYFYELCPPGQASATDALLCAMAEHLPIETSTCIDDFPAEGGRISRDTLPRREDWPEPYYLESLHAHYFGYTVETPSALPLPTRVSAHVAAVRALVNFARMNQLANPSE